MRNKKAWIFWESRRKYWDYSVISLCVYGNPGYQTDSVAGTKTLFLFFPWLVINRLFKFGQLRLELFEGMFYMPLTEVQIYNHV